MSTIFKYIIKSVISLIDRIQELLKQNYLFLPPRPGYILCA